MFAQRVHGAMKKVHSQMRRTPFFIENSTPHLVVEEMDFTRNADADAYIGTGNGQGARRKVGAVPDLTGNLQDALAGGGIYARTSMKSAIYRADGDSS